MTDIGTLAIGGIIAILSSIVTYLLNHYLKIREQTIFRKFEIQEKGRDFFHQTYGAVTTLCDMVAPFSVDKNIKKATILTENGYEYLPKKEIVDRYEETYQMYSYFWYQSRIKGLEIFLSKRFVRIIEEFWAYAGFFYYNTNWQRNKDNIKKFKEVSVQYCDEMDKLMGLIDKKPRIPKWLNLKNTPSTWWRSDSND